MSVSTKKIRINIKYCIKIHPVQKLLPQKRELPLWQFYMFPCLGNQTIIWAEDKVKITMQETFTMSQGLWLAYSPLTMISQIHIAEINKLTS